MVSIPRWAFLRINDPNVLMLLMTMRRDHGGADVFAIPNDLHAKLGMTRKRFAAARTTLEALGMIEAVQKPSRSGAGQYRFTAAMA